MDNEGRYEVIKLLAICCPTSPLLAAIVDGPESNAYSLKDFAGVDSKIKTVEVNDKTFKLQLFEFSKQEQFKFFRTNYQFKPDELSKQKQFKFFQSKPDAIIVIYDVTTIASFNYAKKWLEENDPHINGSVCTFLVGNNYGLDDNDENKVVKTKTAKELESEYNIKLIETSAEDTAQLDQALTDFIKSYNNYKTGAVQMRRGPQFNRN